MSFEASEGTSSGQLTQYGAINYDSPHAGLTVLAQRIRDNRAARAEADPAGEYSRERRRTAFDGLRDNTSGNTGLDVLAARIRDRRTTSD